MLSRHEDLLPGLSGGILCCSSFNIFFPLIAALARFRVLEQAAVLRLGTILPEVDYGRRPLPRSQVDRFGDGPGSAWDSLVSASSATPT